MYFQWGHKMDHMLSIKNKFDSYLLKDNGKIILYVCKDTSMCAISQCTVHVIVVL